MHASHGMYGGDLKTDTVTIIGATLDLQEKVVKQVIPDLRKTLRTPSEILLGYDSYCECFYVVHRLEIGL